jgi:hypothetical protein
MTNEFTAVRLFASYSPEVSDEANIYITPSDLWLQKIAGFNK